MIDDESLMHINDSIFFLYVENAVKWRKLAVTEAAEEYHFWLDSIKAQAWEEGYRAHITRVGINENPYKGENN